MGVISLKEELFLSTHATTWQQLESYCLQMAKGGLKKLSTSEIKDFLTLFKLTSHHLAYAKTHYENSQTTYYLNNLVSKCNGYVYTSPPFNLLDAIKSLFTTYAQLLRKYRSYILLAFGIFLFGSLLSFMMVLANPDYASLFLPESIVDNVHHMSKSSSSGVDVSYPLMSSYVMTNNISVALKAFVYGITLGIGTAYILFANGLLLGGLSALYLLYGDSTYYWSLILPHGIIELTAIFIAGAAGFMVAKAFLLPGSLSRIHSLIQASKEAVSIIGGVIVMLIIAGIIEGFFTPLPISPIVKLLFAGLTALLLGLYYLTGSAKSTH